MAKTLSGVPRAPRHEDRRGRGGRAPSILNLDTRGRPVVAFIHLPREESQYPLYQIIDAAQRGKGLLLQGRSRKIFNF
jgi:hypothetical protein